MGQSDFTTKVQYQHSVAADKFCYMKGSRSAKKPVIKKESTRGCNFRGLAAFHALGISPGINAEQKRLFELALNEAEALACESGVPELVLLTLAEEKVGAARKWLAKQQQFKNRSPQWQLAA